MVSLTGPSVKQRPARPYGGREASRCLPSAWVACSARAPRPPPGSGRPWTRATSTGPSLSGPRRAGVPVTPVYLTRKACASLLVALDVHPRVAMQILRHSKIAVTMEVYAEVVSSSTKDALRRLGEQLEAVGPA
jgi:hypothetical protein